MSCTTILVGKDATYDGSTMIARNDDSGSGHFTAKKFTVVSAKDLPKKYVSVLSHVEIPLPAKGFRYTCTPNAVEGKGIWAAAGVNEKNVGMTATETITSNPRVLGADPLVEYEAAKDGKPEKKGGIGEEDLVVLVLPYIKSAREGVKRLGELLEKYGTYEMNGIAFSDEKEIWWMETIGGHHFIARRVPDDCYVVMPNQLGIDYFDLEDAFGAQREYMCSSDLREFMEENHLNLSMWGSDLSDDEKLDKDIFNPREAFGSQSDADHVYNTPRAWYMLRYFNPMTADFDGPDADFRPQDDYLPWRMSPERKITPEDVKYVLSSHYQGTPYDPYKSYGDKSQAGAYRSIGINRNDFLGFIQIRPYMPAPAKAVEWVAFASNAFNTMVPFYTNVETTPSYMNSTTGTVSTDSFYWTSRLIAAMADASYKTSLNLIERYEEAVLSKAHQILAKTDKIFLDAAAEQKLNDASRKAAAAKKEGAKQVRAKKPVGKAEAIKICTAANEETAAMVRKEAEETLSKVLDACSNSMKNQYARSDA